MVVKTDMSKAYNRIEWGFLRAVLERLGFQDIWIDWIMECVTMISYSFLINGTPNGRVLPSRGLRQGDPLSPYLFILCMKVLSGLAKKYIVPGNSKEYKWLEKVRISTTYFSRMTQYFFDALMRCVAKNWSTSKESTNNAPANV